MSSTARTWLIAIAAAAIGLALGGIAVWTYQQQQLADARRQVDEAQARRAEAESRTASLEETVQALVSSATAAAESPDADEEVKATTKERRFAFIKEVTAGSTPSLVADYAEFLMGKDAAAAAKARGDESPPPNDYYIVNDNTKLRTLRIKTGIPVRLTSNPDGTSDPAGYTTDLDTWAGYFAAPTEENVGIRTGGYWLGIENGVVVSIEEQYTP